MTQGQESYVQSTLAAARLARVSGVVVDSSGKALTTGMVMLMPTNGMIAGGMLTTGQIATDGAFSVNNVAPATMS